MVSSILCLSDDLQADASHLRVEPQKNHSYKRCFLTLAAVCECFGVRGRDIPDLFFSVHFSCMQYVEKPGDYPSEYGK